jgi:hypothetical protein
MGFIVRGFQVIVRLLNVACGNALPAEDEGRARRLQLAIGAMLLSLVFAVIWGVAVGVRIPGLAMANAYKVPIIIFLSSMFAVPAGLLTWKLSGAQCSATDLLLGFATGVFSGTLVLAVLAPIVALYYESSWWAGPVLAQIAIGVALLVGSVVMARSVMSRAHGPKRTITLSIVVLKVMQIAALLQLIALLSPILPERTHADHGIDGFAHPIERQ